MAHLLFIRIEYMDIVIFPFVNAVCSGLILLINEREHELAKYFVTCFGAVTFAVCIFLSVSSDEFYHTRDHKIRIHFI